MCLHCLVGFRCELHRSLLGRQEVLALGLPLALLLENHSSQQRLYSLKVRIRAGLSCHPLIDAPCNTSHVLLVRRRLLPLHLSV